jgi:hypothetical protein
VDGDSRSKTDQDEKPVVVVPFYGRHFDSFLDGDSHSEKSKT